MSNTSNPDLSSKDDKPDIAEMPQSVVDDLKRMASQPPPHKRKRSKKDERRIAHANEVFRLYTGIEALARRLKDDGDDELCRETAITLDACTMLMDDTNFLTGWEPYE